MWIFLAIATAVVMVVPVCLQLWGRAIQQTATASVSFPHAITKVQLDMGDARVSVGPGPEGQARVYQKLKWALSKPTVDKRLVGDVLYVTFRCSDPANLYNGLECGGDIDVQVPPGVRLTAVSGSGEISVRGLSGDLDLRTGAGEIRIADTRGNLRARAGSGTVDATGLAAPTTRAQVSSGVLDLRYVRPPDFVEATANSGTVKLIVPQGSHYRISDETGNGQTHVNRALNDNGSKQEISVRSGSGSVYVDTRDD
ncbi:hypothetical protein E1298_41510 [Actinomadura rubrisoli]|uniref:DUF4097 domain-containing protein n=1 Tax=Actinomadura rubrisoli TaxID=2530368 RepID=A0A4V2YR98_9ACTN|nr:hypothetical protein E1298_41510 [Actinomadura rubrisoli]